MPGGAILEGTVSEFDDAAGIGTIAVDGGDRYAFQCIELADGTRTAAVGERVVFRPLARFGVYQAGAIRKL